MSPRSQVAEHFIENADGLLAALPLGLRAQQVFLGHHLQDGPTFCAIPPWTSTRLSCSFSRVSCGTSSG